MSESFRTTSIYLILVDFTILTFANPSHPPGDANVKINPLEIIYRSDKEAGFKVLPRRWVVERTFGWMSSA